MSQDQPFECNAPDVVFENFGDEVVLLNLQSGRYYSLDPLGMLYWESLSRGVPPREIAAHIVRSYTGSADGSVIAKDLDDLFLELRSEQLIRRSSNPPRPISDVPEVGTKLPAEYARPVLSIFDDVAEMLMLDPVHEVGEVGWPQPVPLDRKQE